MKWRLLYDNGSTVAPDFLFTLLELKDAPILDKYGYIDTRLFNPLPFKFDPKESRPCLGTYEFGDNGYEEVVFLFKNPSKSCILLLRVKYNELPKEMAKDLHSFTHKYLWNFNHHECTTFIKFLETGDENIYKKSCKMIENRMSAANKKYCQETNQWS